MTQEEIMAIANTINAQLAWSAPVCPIQWSWGVSKKIASLYRGMATLKLRVSGLVHKGWVLISLNQGSDTYEVRTIDMRGTIKQERLDVYCDQLGKVVDEMVERPADMDTDTYAKEALADSDKKTA